MSVLSPEEIKAVQDELKHYPQKRGASIEALKIVQKKRGWVSDEALRELAALLDMSPEELDNTATFYSLIYRRPVGRHVILSCDSVSCWIMGSDGVRISLEQKLGIKPGQTTPDGRFTLLPVACLGCCDKAPALMIGDDLHTQVDPAKVDELLAKYR